MRGRPTYYIGSETRPGYIGNPAGMLYVVLVVHRRRVRGAASACVTAETCAHEQEEQITTHGS